MQVDVEFTSSGAVDNGTHNDHVVNPEMCCLRCRAHEWCQAWTWVKDAHLKWGIKSQCWLKAAKPGGSRPRPGFVSGLVERTAADRRDKAEKSGFGCQASPLPGLWPPAIAGGPVQVKALSHNLCWWRVFDRMAGSEVAALLARSGRPRPYDVMGFQECEDPDYLLMHAGLAGRYGAIRGDKSLCMAYRKSTWSLISHGQDHVSADRQFGKRDAQWMRLHSQQSGRTLFFVNHHGPLPLNSGGVCGGGAVATNLVTLVAQRAQRGDAVIIVGDFNSDPGSITIRTLQQRLRLALGHGPDSILTNLQVIGSKNLGGGGSDHDAVAMFAQAGAAASRIL